MATLKEHQAAMVDLLANGSGIPASASRLAHAMHDVLEMLQGVKATASTETSMAMSMLDDATTPGLNDKALSKREKALKTDSPAKWPTPAEQRVKELENTIRQLKANNAKLKADLKAWDSVDAEFRKPYYPDARLERLNSLEVAWCHMSGEEPHDVVSEALKVGADYAELGMKYAELVKILAFYGVDDLDKARAEYLKYNGRHEQAGCRKADTRVCEHEMRFVSDESFDVYCIKCGAPKQ